MEQNVVKKQQWDKIKLKDWESFCKDDDDDDDDDDDKWGPIHPFRSQKTKGAIKI